MDSVWLRAAALAVVLLLAIPARAQPAGKLQEVTLRVGPLERSASMYVPANLPPGRPLVLALHGSGMTGANMRTSTEGLFEKLADRDGFAVAYPDGAHTSWNDCRKLGPSPARVAGVDDVSFLRAVVRWSVDQLQTDPARVYVFGFSAGGHMAYRLAWEAPAEFAAFAVVAASLPTVESLDCAATGKPPRIMLVHGDSDRINPYEGGLHATGATVLSARASAAAFAQQHGLGDAAPEVDIPALTGSDPVAARLLAWNRGQQPAVALYSVLRGGHSIPTLRFDAPAAAWKFFVSP